MGRLSCDVLIDQSVFESCAWAIVRANERVMYAKYLVSVHLKIRFSTVPPTLRAKVVAWALVVNLRQARDSMPPK